MYRIKLLLSLTLLLLSTSNSNAQKADNDRFPSETVWFNSMGPVSLNIANKKLVVVLITTMDCLECGYYAKQLERKSETLTAVELIQLIVPKDNNAIPRSEVNLFIQQNSYSHPIGIIPNLEVYKGYNITQVPYFLVYDRSTSPAISASGESGFIQALQKLDALESDKKGTAANYSTYKIMPLIQPSKWANPIIETPTYIAQQETGNGFFINDLAHHRIIAMDRNGVCENVYGNTIYPGLNIEERGNIRFLHAGGFTAFNGNLYIADSYNNLLRQLNLESTSITTVIGDGSLDSLSIPTDVEIWKRKMYVADGLKNQIQQVDIAKRTAKVFASLPNGYDGYSRIYPINLAAGKNGLYVVMSNGEVYSINKKGKTQLLPIPKDIRVSSICEWRGGIVACSALDNAIYYGKKDSWKLLTNGSDSASLSAGVSKLKRPFDVAVIANELYVTDSYNHQIRIIHSEKESTPQPMRLELSDLLISEEPSHTYGQAVVLDSISVFDSAVLVKVHLDLQGYEIYADGKNLVHMHDSPEAGEVQEGSFTQNEFVFSVNADQGGEMLYFEFYATVVNPKEPAVPIIKRSYLIIPVEHAIKAKPFQEITYRPDLLPN